MKAFIVEGKDLFDKKKNPNFVLSVDKIRKNKKIRKYPVNKGEKNGKKEK